MKCSSLSKTGVSGVIKKVALHRPGPYSAGSLRVPGRSMIASSTIASTVQESSEIDTSWIVSTVIGSIKEGFGFHVLLHI